MDPIILYGFWNILEYHGKILNSNPNISKTDGPFACRFVEKIEGILYLL